MISNLYIIIFIIAYILRLSRAWWDTSCTLPNEWPKRLKLFIPEYCTVNFETQSISLLSVKPSSVARNASVTRAHSKMLLALEASSPSFRRVLWRCYSTLPILESIACTSFLRTMKYCLEKPPSAAWPSTLTMTSPFNKKRWKRVGKN